MAYTNLMIFTFKRFKTFSTIIFGSAISLLSVACSGEATQTDVIDIASDARSTSQDVTQVAEAAHPGKSVFRKCRSCHTLNEGGRNRVGPNLWGIFGLQAASKDGFSYSKALRASEIIWTDETLSAYIENPNKYVPGGRMSFAGIRDAGQRADLIAYLRLETGAEIKTQNDETIEASEQ